MYTQLHVGSWFIYYVVANHTYHIHNTTSESVLVLKASAQFVYVRALYNQPSNIYKSPVIVDSTCMRPLIGPRLIADT